MISDTPARYGLLSRTLHWGMAALFAAQFISAAAHWALPRENTLREALWSYHNDLGMTLFLLVLVRGVWGLMNIPRRPEQSGRMGTAAVAGHVAIYALMVIVPASRILAAAGSTRGLSYFGIEIFAPRDVEVAWMQVAAEWHGTMGWILGLLVLGHIAMAAIWHRMVRRDGVLERMA
ncbi:MAG: cytochrome b [Silicimonas sp.]|nr:cytochrome b [Silicimonas sp.]NND43385.1 cytochrome b [Silicimonas sp.]